mmetsp:Transcript_8478/g.27713  ORF Transcript_8478/g.27713 Transcript_8478/m.27713 type:complete len:252 (-) Transcript_8478:41-796(-)
MGGCCSKSHEAQYAESVAAQQGKNYTIMDKLTRRTSYVGMQKGIGKAMRSFTMVRDMGVELAPLENLFERFSMADNDGSGTIELAEMCKVFGLGPNPWGPLMFRCLDKDGEGGIGFREFVYGIAKIKPATTSSGSQKARLEFLFNLLDRNRVKAVTRASMIADLKSVQGRCSLVKFRALKPKEAGSRDSITGDIETNLEKRLKAGKNMEDEAIDLSDTIRSQDGLPPGGLITVKELADLVRQHGKAFQSKP